MSNPLFTYPPAAPMIPTIANMNEVVMKKTELLEHLVENKAKHDLVLAAAISGYWTLAKERIAGKRKKLQEQVVEFAGNCELEFARLDRRIESKDALPSHVRVSMISLDTNLDLVYPQDHSRDYERAIKMMEASVYDEVRLSVDEFDSYVLNNWEWKDNFLTSSLAYTRAITGCYLPNSSLISGCVAPMAMKAGVVYNDIYGKAVNRAANLFHYSGINAATF